MPALVPLDQQTSPLVTGLYSLEWDGAKCKRASPRRGSNPGQFLEKLCPEYAHIKADARKSFLDGWVLLAKQSALNGVSAALIQRREAQLTDSTGAASFEGKVVWRMVIGMSSPNPLETSITLHPQYGIPLIPGSSVKGLTRAWCLLTLGYDLGIYPMARKDYLMRKFETKIVDGKEVFNKNGKKLIRRNTPLDTPMELLEAFLVAVDSEEEGSAEDQRQVLLEKLKSDLAVKTWNKVKESQLPRGILAKSTFEEVLALEKAKHFLPVFGVTDRQGEVNFYDALPICWSYKVDVMTPHYGPYYRGELDDQGKPIPPADWLEPIPITFLALDKGTRFRFDVQSANSELAPIALKWLKAAVQEFGAGGKTMTGYGEIKSI
jgi:CRISPR type III-B/RAMP module RAMP protein Cmr6